MFETTCDPVSYGALQPLLEGQMSIDDIDTAVPAAAECAGAGAGEEQP